MYGSIFEVFLGNIYIFLFKMFNENLLLGINVVIFNMEIYRGMIK